MRNFLIVIVCLTGILTFSVSSAAKNKSDSNCDCMKYLKSVTVEVTDIENGTIIKITADKPGVIKQIQDWANKSFIPTNSVKTETVRKDTTVKAYSKGTNLEEVDPICGKKVNICTSVKAPYQGQIYYFCSESCKKKFLKEPDKYIK